MLSFFWEARNTHRRIGEEVASWGAERNGQQVKVHWRITTQDARIKLKRLYPILEKAGA